MIALDENMVGSDDDRVIVQGLRSCLALFCKTGNGQLIGAHFTTADSLDNLKVMMDFIRKQANYHINLIAMFANFQHWSNAKSGLNNQSKLADYFKTNLVYFDLCEVIYHDITRYSSFDVKCINGPIPQFSCRPTPDPNPRTSTPSPRVFWLRGAATGSGVLVATNAANVSIYHCVPNNQNRGFLLL